MSGLKKKRSRRVDELEMEDEDDELWIEDEDEY